MKRLLLIFLVSYSLLGSGCAVPGKAGVDAFYRGEPMRAMELFEEEMEEGGKDYALLANSLGSAAMAAGDPQAALRAFLEGYAVMEDFSPGGARETLALLGSEEEKIYKGDPYERAMNSFYIGLLRYMERDYYNALAGFKNGNLCDGDTVEEKYQSDFGLLHFMEGKSYLKIGERENAGRAFLNAQETDPENPFFRIEPNLDNNLLILIDLGIGPEKYSTGPHSSLAVFRPVPYPEAYAEIFLDGCSIGRTHRAADLFFQASTRGGRKMDAIQQGKAVLKETAVSGGAVLMTQGKSDSQRAVGAGVTLLGLLFPAQADIRHWAALPGEVHVFVSKADPGEHSLQLRFFDQSGKPVPGLDQSYSGLIIEEGEEKVLYFRSGFPRSRME